MKWEFRDGTRYFLFFVLHFGLSPACYVFTKVLRSLVRKWRRQGLKSIIFVDDGITGQNTYDKAKRASEIILHDLEHSGFVVNFEKSNFHPTQIGEWLGTIINTQSMKFFVPETKIEKLLNFISKVLNQRFSSARQLSQIAGTLSSMHSALGPCVRMFTRAMYKDIETRITWNTSIIISEDTRREFKFWKENLYHKNGFSFSL